VPDRTTLAELRIGSRGSRCCRVYLQSVQTPEIVATSTTQILSKNLAISRKCFKRSSSHVAASMPPQRAAIVGRVFLVGCEGFDTSP